MLKPVKDRGRFSRRELGRFLIAGALAANLLPTFGSAAQRHVNQGESNAMVRSDDYFAYVGARTTRERDARGDGLNVYRVDAATGHWTHVQLVGDLVNPSFLAFDRSRNFLYTVHGDLSDITSFAIDAQTGKLRQINRQSTQGKNPVHLAFDPINRFVVVANHITSTLALLPREQDGSLGEVVDLVKLEGKPGPHRVEQPFAKPHQVEFDPSGRFIVVPDKGLDAVFTYRIDAEAKKLLPATKPVEAREGSGPRHVAFDSTGRTAYVINELDSTVTAYRFDPTTGSLMPFQIVSSLPDTFTGNNRASEIAVSPDGRFVYASNRGYDCIVIFAVDPSSNRLSPISWQTTDGRTPRFFAIDPNHRVLFVANEDSDTIVPFDIDQPTGKLNRSPAQSIRVGSPVCVLFKAVH
jgi:6-phosphogluconolactonase (cycloisomerase 2 family)